MPREKVREKAGGDDDRRRPGGPGTERGSSATRAGAGHDVRPAGASRVR